MTPEQIQTEAVELMSAASELTIGLSQNEEAYDLPYIAKQLSKCSTYGERLADMMARLAQLRVSTMQQVDRAANLLEQAKAEREISPEGQGFKPASARLSWVRIQTAPETDTWKTWKTTEMVVREAKEDVGRRAETVKRLDSDLRLHQRIIEAKITAGAMGQPDLTSGKPDYRGRPRDVLPERRADDTPDDIHLD